MQPKRRRVVNRRVLVRRVEALLVHAVAGLVDGGVDRRHQVALVDPRRHAHVAQRYRHREGMGGSILPAGAQVVADVRQQPHRQIPLRGVREHAPVEHRRRQLAGGHDRRQQLLKLVAKLKQQRLQPHHPHARFVLVEQRVVALALIADQVSLLALERDHLLERRSVEVEVALLTGHPPGIDAAPLGQCQPANERRRQLHRAAPVAAQDPHHRGASRIERLVLSPVEQLSQPGVHHPLVQHHPHSGLLTGTRVAASQRHAGLLIPAQQGGHVAEIGELPHACGELGPCICHR